MSKRTDVLFALRDRFDVALDGVQVDVVGLDGLDAAPTRARGKGRLLIATGDPGPAEVDLSPLSYHYDHEIPLVLLAFPGSESADDRLLDPMLMLMAEVIRLDPTLGGLCDWCEFVAPSTDAETATDGAVIGRSAEFAIIASYSASHPLA